MYKRVCFFNWADWRKDIAGGATGRLSSNTREWKYISQEPTLDPQTERWIVAARQKEGRWGTIAWLKVRRRKADESQGDGHGKFVYYDQAASRLFGDPDSGAVPVLEEIDTILKRHFPKKQQGLAGSQFDAFRDDSNAIIAALAKGGVPLSSFPHASEAALKGA